MLDYRERRRLLEEQAWRAKIETKVARADSSGWRRIRELGISAMVASVITLLLSPFSQTISYYMTEYLSRPIMSVEYVDLVRSAPAFVPPSEAIEDLIRSPAYMSYVSSHLELTYTLSLGLHKRASASEIDTISQTVITLIHRLKKREDRIRLAREQINDRDYASDPKSVISAYFGGEFNPYATSNAPTAKIKEAFLTQIGAEDDRDSSLLRLTEKLKAALDDIRLPSTGLTLKVSVENRGNTDGLVLNKAILSIQSVPVSVIPLSRVPAPKPTRPDDGLAVRTVVTNPPETAVQGSVGRVEKHTMTEFWFRCADESRPEYRAAIKALLNAHRSEGFSVTLFDQEGRPFRYSRRSNMQNAPLLGAHIGGER